MDPRTEFLTAQQRAIADAVQQPVEIAGDLFQVAPHRWAIYARIPVDGNVLVAEYETAQTARDVLEFLPIPADVSPPLPQRRDPIR